MMVRGCLRFIALGTACGACVGQETAEETAPAAVVQDTVVLETNAGRIVIALDNARAPVSVENFLLHVRSGFYNGVVFHRVEEGFVIQAGELDANGAKRVSPVFPIQNEATNGVRNLRGTVAMARTGNPHSATSQFFFNLVDNTKLDHSAETSAGWGYAVFGRVVEGMDVVDSIGRARTVPRRSYPHFPVESFVITRASILTE